MTQNDIASLTNGSSITASGVSILTTSAAVTDISASLNGTTLAIESSDADIYNLSIRVNLNAATVSKVTLNGKEVAFSTASDATVLVGRRLIHFNGDAAGDLSNWTLNLTTLTTNTYKRNGYTFKGWATTKGGSVVYTDGQSVKNITNIPDSTVTLYAVWEAIPYTVIFQNYDGKELARQSVTYGKTATYTGATPTKAYDETNHYTFSGWDKSLTNITGNLTVTAQFTTAAHSYSYTSKDTTNHTAKCACGYSKNLAHTWDSGSVTTQPTCTVAGVKTFTCSVCKGSKTQSISATGHTEVIDEAVAPTCTENGYTAGSHCSVCKDYLVKKASEESATAEFKTMAVDMLTYGAAAQTIFAYGADNLVTADLSDDLLAFATVETPDATDIFATSGNGANISVVVTVGSRVELGLSVFKAGLTNPENVRCEIRDEKGNLLAEPEITNTANVIFAAGYSNVGAREMRKPITATFYMGDEQISQTITWSVESYVAQTRANANATTSDIAMVDSMLTYGDAVANYLTSIGQ